MRKYGKDAINCFSTTMLFKIARLVFYKAMDPTLHYKMKADEVYDRSGGRVATPIQTNRNWMSRRGCRLGDTNTEIETDSCQC